MTPEAIFLSLQARFGESVVFAFSSDPKKDKDPWFGCAAESIALVAKHLRDDEACSFDYLECLTGTDYPDKGEIHVTLHLASYALRHRLVIKCALSRDNPRMPTLSNVWPVANWHERECFDLLGVTFEGHPDLRRLLLPEDWEGHPLRKDFAEKGHYNGIPTTRDNPLDLVQIGLRPPEP